MSKRHWPRAAHEHLTFLYGEARADALLEQLDHLLKSSDLPSHTVTQRDSILITYGDQFRRRDEAPLQTLADFAQRHLGGRLSAIHILPFYPYSSDDGFSVIDYRAVDPALGEWDDIRHIGKNFQLMFDAVINHISAHSEWFKRFLQDDPKYRDWFIVVDKDRDLSMVVRPRALPLLTQFDTPSGPKHVWTTFSEDQIDLNFENPHLLLEIIELLLFYVSNGAQFIRLDAIAFMWKAIGSPSIHLQQTHRIIQLFRVVLEQVAPDVMLITETNVPHKDNISYFGDGYNEAQMVYNFALPPLTLHAFQTGSAETLSRWAADLTLPSERTTFFNFLASHDGIGLNPARGILSEPEIDALVTQTQAHGGYVSYKENPDGTRSPYELNINYFDALSNPKGDDPLETQIDRFIASQAIMLALVGVPGIYVHSLLGSRSDHAGVERTGRYRSINRHKFDHVQLERELAQPTSLRARVFNRYASLLKARASQPAFDPYGRQHVLNAHTSIFAVLRSTRDATSNVLCVHNVSAEPQLLDVDLGTDQYRVAIDLLTAQTYGVESDGRLTLNVDAYQVYWLNLAK